MASLGDMTWRRGDSYTFTLTIKDATTSQPIDITGYSFKFTVNTEKSPVDDTNQKFQVVGVVDPDQVTNTGKVGFTPTTTDTDIAEAKYYYDVEMTDSSGNIRTISPVGAKFDMRQDITKT